MKKRTKMILHNKKKKKHNLGVWGKHSGRLDWERNSAEQDGRDRARRGPEVGLQLKWSQAVQRLSCVRLCNPMVRSTPGFLSITNFWSLLKLTSIE